MHTNIGLETSSITILNIKMNILMEQLLKAHRDCAGAGLRGDLAHVLVRVRLAALEQGRGLAALAGRPERLCEVPPRRNCLPFFI